MDEYLREFVQESEERIEELNAALVALERDPDDDDAMERIFRTAHTLKGNAGAMGFESASRVGHVVEEVLDGMRQNRLDPTAETMDRVFEAVDTLESMVAEIREHGQPQSDPTPVIEAIEEAVEASEGSMEVVALDPPTTSEITSTLEGTREPASADADCYHVRLAVTEDERAVGIDGMLVLEALADAFDVLGTTPAPEMIQRGEYDTGFDAIIASAIGRGDIAAALEAVDQVDDVIVTNVTEHVSWGVSPSEPASTADTTDDLGINELLDEFDQFDDIEGIDPGEVDDIELADDLGDSGTFEDATVSSADPEIDDVEVDELLDGVETAEEEGLDPAGGIANEPKDASETFEELKSEVQQVSYDELQDELDELEFEELDDDEEEIGFDELLEGDIDVGGDADELESLGAFDSEFDESGDDIDGLVEDDDAAEEFDDLEIDEPSVDAEPETVATDRDAEETTAEAGDEPGDRTTSSELDDSSSPEPDRLSGGDTARPADVQTIRVDIDRLDELYAQLQELVTTRIMLRRAIEESDAEVDTALDILEDLETVTDRLQDTVMDARLVPLERTVGRLPRVVRDLAREMDKEVTFETSGTGVELDRAILDELGDPLIHLIRNAVDHGIESPDEREEAGKPRGGLVELRAERARDRAIVEVVDDGRGLDADQLRSAAVEAGLVEPSEAESIPDDDVYDLAFHPGLTTTEEVTDVSGRGVGMDVVRETVSNLDGTVQVESEPGAGTTIRLDLPVSLATIRVLFVESGGEQYGVPAGAVDEISRVRRIEMVDGREIHTHEDDVYPVVRLGSALDVPGETRNGDGRLLRIDNEVRQIVLHCDDVVDQEEVVVKPLEGMLSGVPGLGGATVLGEGDVVPILDVESL